MAIRVVLADDSPSVREVLAEILGQSSEIDLVALAQDEPTLLAAVETFHPDVVVTDVRMPPTGTDEGVRVAESLAATHPDIGVVILSQYSDPSWLSRVFDGGRQNRAWVMKERAADEGQLIKAVRTVGEGARWVDPSIIPPD